MNKRRTKEYLDYQVKLLNIDTLKLGDKGTKKATGIRIFFPPFSRDNANLRLFKVMEVAD